MQPFVLKMVAAVVFFAVCSETIVEFLSSNRRMLLCVILIATLYVEKMLRSFIGSKEEQSKTTTASIVRENYELSRTVMNMSEQHILLCEIRGSITRVVRLSKETLQELKPRRFSESEIFQKGKHSTSTKSLPTPKMLDLSRSNFSNSWPKIIPDFSEDMNHETGGSAPVSPSPLPL